MKNIFILLAALVLITFNCTKPMSPLNVDPKRATSALAIALFTQAQKTFADANSTTSIGVAPFRVISQEWTENSSIPFPKYDDAKTVYADLLMRVDTCIAAAKVKEAINTGVFQSNNDNALFLYDPASPTKSNPVWQAIFYRGRHDFVPANLLVSTMTGWHDPRVPYYFTQYNGGYSGGDPGQGNGSGHFSDFGAALYTAALPADLLDYSEVQFY
jgi:hypothetical protein